MGKSYKKHPFIVQDKEEKKDLNRKLRRDKYTEFKTPGAFKRHRPHWGYKYIWTRDQAIEDYYGGVLREYIKKRYPTIEDWLDYWERCVVRK